MALTVPHCRSVTWEGTCPRLCAIARLLAGLLFTCYLVAQGLLIGAGLAVGRELSEERATEQVALMLGR